MRYGFGIDVGGTTIKIAFFDQEGRMKTKWEIPTNPANGGQAILPDIAGAVRDFLNRESIPDEQIIGIGIGVPGPVSDEGIVNKCVNLGWGVVDLHSRLSELTGFRVKAGNDANVAALGECWMGGGQGTLNMVLATLGTGIGGGIILHGKILSGVHGAGGEIGHMPVMADDPETCGCGKRGCAEQYCSATGVVRMAKRYLQSHDVDSSLRAVMDLQCKDVFDAAAAGDWAACEILEEVYSIMGRFLASIACVVDPEVIVLGGGVSKAGEPLIEGVTRYFERYAFHACRSTRILLAKLGNDAGAYGAFKLVLDEYG